MRELAAKVCYGLAGGIAFVVIGWWVYVGVEVVRHQMKRLL